MVTPDRRRRAVVRCCRIGSGYRSAGPAGWWVSIVPLNATRHGRVPPDDVKLRARLRRFARRHPRLGWRKAHTVVRREGFVVNHKKLRVCGGRRACAGHRPRKNKKRRPGGLDGILLTSLPSQPCVGLDFEFDETADLRRLKLLNIVDEHTREALAMDVSTVDHRRRRRRHLLERLVTERGAPRYLRMDNGPELIAWILRDWCRLTRSRHHLHRTRLSLGEPLGRVVQRPGPRRTVEHHRIRIPDRSTDTHRRLEESNTTPGGRTRLSEDSPPPSTLPNANTNTNRHTHNSWTNHRGPVCVSPMSSGLCEWGCLGVGEEGSVDDVGEFAFEESEGFSFG